MNWPDEKNTAILSLLLIASFVIFTVKGEGLDVVTNVVCAIGGLVTGNALEKVK